MLARHRPGHVRALLVVASLACATPVLIVRPRAAHAGEPSGSGAMKAEARVHLEQGLAAYSEKDWERAIREFRAGYDIDPRPDFLFAWAQAERLSGDCAAAIELYEKFIATHPSPEQADAAQQMSDRCRETVTQTRPAPEPKKAREPDEGEVVPRKLRAAPAPSAGGERTWWKDGWGAGLAGAGVVGVGLGVGLYVAASSSDDAADRAATYDEFAQRKDEAAGRRSFAALSLGAGAALLVAGGVRYYLVHRRESRSHDATGVALSFTPGGGASLWVGGTF